MSRPQAGGHWRGLLPLHQPAAHPVTAAASRPQAAWRPADSRARLRARAGAAALLPAALLLAACSLREGGNEPPPRLEKAAEIPVFESRVALPVTIPLATLERMVNEAVPQRLVTIERDFDVCVEPARIKIGKRRIAVTPRIRCRIVGHVDRGPIRLSANGRAGEGVRMAMPVSATVQARDIGRIIAHETATAAADVRAVLRLRLDANWQPVARIAIDYDWTNKPGIDLLGRRITFAGRADPELARIIADLERELPKKLQTLDLRKQAGEVWAEGFTAISINRADPEVWLRLTPRRIASGGFRVEGDRLVALLALEAGTETILGPRPPDPAPAPLPPLGLLQPGRYGVRFAAPVVADFAELEPVLARELDKLSGQSIDVPLAGRVEVRFDRPTIYTTEGGKLAIGLPMQVKAARQIFSTRGTVWLTGVPVNEPNSRKVRVSSLEIFGEADTLAGDLLLAVAESPRVLGSIEAALAHDFEGDFQTLMGKVNRVLGGLPIGKEFVAVARVEGVRNGVVQPIGQGLFMPVEAYGRAELRYDPQAVQRILAERAREREARRAAREARAREAAAAAAGSPAGAP
jgi:hypothetical protein